MDLGSALLRREFITIGYGKRQIMQLGEVPCIVQSGSDRCYGRDNIYINEINAFVVYTE